MQAVSGLLCEGLGDPERHSTTKPVVAEWSLGLDGLQQVAVAGLLVSLGVLVPWVVLYTVVLGGCGRWSARQWGIAA